MGSAHNQETSAAFQNRNDCNTLVVNLYGGPGTGKSTGAAIITGLLKANGIDAEYVSEVAKDKVWEENREALSNQAYMFGSQYYRISRVLGKVDVVVTDSPLLLTFVYNHDERLGNAFNAVALNVATSYNTLEVLLQRVKKYNPNGRMQTEAESDEITKQIVSVLDRFRGGYMKATGDIAGYWEVFMEIARRIGREDVLLPTYNSLVSVNRPFSAENQWK